MQQLLQEEYKDLHIVLGMVNDKNIEDLLVLFPKDASYYFCKPNIPRGLEVVTLKSCANAIGLKGEVFDSVNQAYNIIRTYVWISFNAIKSGIQHLLYMLSN